MKNLIKAASIATLLAASASAQAWWGPWNNGYNDNSWFGDGWGDFNMNMSARGNGWGRGYNNYYNPYYYGPYGYGYPAYGAPYGYAPYAAPAAPAAPAAKQAD